MTTRASSPISLGGEILTSMRLAVPLMFAFLVQGITRFVGVFMIAKLGRDPLDANALATDTFFTISVIIIGILGSVNILIAQAHGRGNNETIAKIAAQGIMVSILLGIPASILIWESARLLFLSKQVSGTIAMASALLHTYALAATPGMFIYVLEAILIGISRPKLVLYVSVFEVACEVLLSYVFIFGKFGMPALGATGLGVAYAITFIGVALVLFSILVFHPRFRCYPILRYLYRPSFNYFRRIIGLGLPIGVMFGIELIFFTACTFLMGRVSAEYLAAHQIALQYYNIPLMAIFAVGQVTTVRVGFENGQGNQESLLKIFYANLIIIFSALALVITLLLHLKTALIKFDIGSITQKNFLILKHAELLLTISVFSMLSDALRWVGYGGLRGLEDTKVPMFAALITMWLIGLPLQYLLCLGLDFQGAGLWFGSAGILAMSGIFYWLRLKSIAKSYSLVPQF